MPIQSRGIPALSAMVRESGPNVAQGLLHIVLTFAAAGFAIEFIENDAGKTEAKFKRRDDWPHSVIVNKADLLFYLRDITAGVVPDPTGFPFERGHRNERKVRISTLPEAESLTTFLLPYLK
jgi:hypothetical protein